ncbi:MAG TPA: DUF309 domain-containing protein [Thermoanaerobaculia bacterium]|nr:DUF309 domain-containing protein [Thermoanaerobaculia bacterium]
MRRRTGLHRASACERGSRAAHVPARRKAVVLTGEPPEGHGLEGGRRLFNAGHFFEAHEVWEAEWLVATGPRRLLLQGLIQVAAALYKAARQERPAGCLQLLTEASAKLELFADGDGDLALADFRRDVAKAREEAAAWSAGGPPLDRASFPALRLREKS